MLGWSIRARAWRSASNRASTWRESMPGLMILRATCARTGSSCSAMIDDAHAAFADLLEQLVGADFGARAFGGRWWGSGTRGGEGGTAEEVARSLVGGEQGLNSQAEFRAPSQAWSRYAARSAGSSISRAARKSESLGHGGNSGLGLS